ncbi:MAG: O-antigen ligase family protein [Parcubacteria group bacterium]|nr:O-antigen ligase family protein [Parcubacteria group bacterium]
MMSIFSRRRLEESLFYVLLVFIPFGIKKVEAIFVYPWGSKPIFLYMIDIAILFLFLFWYLRKGWRDIVFSSSTKALLLFSSSAILSLVFAFHRGLGAYTLLHLLYGVFLFFYLSTHPFLKQEVAFRAILVGVALQTIVGLLQFQAQKSIGISYLGETFFGAHIPGTATFYFGAEKLVRVPGTFLHPNILGAFLLMGSLLTLYFFLRGKKIFSFFGWSFLYYSINLLLLLTFSRSSITTVSLLTLIYCAVSYRTYHAKILRVFLIWFFVLLTLWSMFGNVLKARFENSFNELSYKHRVIYNEIGVRVIKEHPLFGVGIGNFTDYAFREKLYQARQLSFSFLYQPIHNLYLLITAEIGVLGFLAFFIFLILLFKTRMYEVFIDERVLVLSCIMGGFLILGLADHYFWDLEQGIVMFWLIVGLFNYKEN